MPMIVFCDKFSCKHCMEGMVCSCEALDLTDSVKQGLDQQVVCKNFEVISIDE